VTVSTRQRPVRRRRGRRRAVRWTIAVALAVAVFGLGVAVGEALHDNPKPDGGLVTYVRTLTHP
jgi:hypothetical protein